MMMVKISDSDNLKIWCQEVAISQNTQYHFEAFATGLRINHPPILRLKINDEVLSSGTLGSIACSWQKVNGDWNSGNNSFAMLCLSVSDEDLGAETDFALDDIGFFEVCEVSDEVNIEVIPFEVPSDNDIVQLPCGESIALITEVNSTLENIEFVWSTEDANIVSVSEDGRVLVDASRIYNLEVTPQNSQITCQDELDIEVKEICNVDILISTLDILNYHQPELELVAVQSGNSSDYIFSWNT